MPGLVYEKYVKPLEKPNTQRGYNLFELLSALQKDIRRGNEYEALFWAVELESFSIRALWNRPKVIASEDIGSANPVMPVVIDTLEKQYFEAKTRGDDAYRLFLTNAVVNLVRSKKSRIADDLLNVVYGEIQHEDKRLPIPDYALDMHTLKGKNMGRGWDHFFSEGCKLENEAFENPYTEKAKAVLEKYGKLKPEVTIEKKDTSASKTEEKQRNLIDFAKMKIYTEVAEKECE